MFSSHGVCQKSVARGELSLLHLFECVHKTCVDSLWAQLLLRLYHMLLGH